MVKKIALLLVILIILLQGCAPTMNISDKTDDKDINYMADAAKELMDILWNIDYHTFTPDETTLYAKKYYDSDFLADYLKDINANSGVEAIKGEKLISKVVSISEEGSGQEVLGSMLYKKYMLKVKIQIVNYEPFEPEESFFEKGKTYTLLYTLYFKNQNGVLKLSAYGFEPENEVFLPKKADNKVLDASEVKSMVETAKKYYDIRYNFDYKTYDPGTIENFYKNNATQTFLEGEGLTDKYLNDFKTDLNEYKMKAQIVNLKIISANNNKSSVETIEGTTYYYILTAELNYKINATPEYYAHAEEKEGETVTIREKLGFVFDNGKPKIAYAEYIE